MLGPFRSLLEAKNMFIYIKIHASIVQGLTCQNSHTIIMPVNVKKTIVHVFLDFFTKPQPIFFPALREGKNIASSIAPLKTFE